MLSGSKSLAKRLRPGDVFRFDTKKGPGFLQYVGRHPEYGYAVVVDPLIGGNASSSRFQHGYIIFYPLGAALWHRLVEAIDHFAPPLMPQVFRRPGARIATRIENWIVESGGTETLRSRLSQEELRLPIASIWNHEFLVTRVMEGWDPTKAGADE